MIILAVLWILIEIAKRRLAKKKGEKFKDSKTLQSILDYIFRNGPPSMIILTNRNEVFFGPNKDMTYDRVPAEMVPAMDYNDQWALGYELAKRTGYLICNRSEKTLRTTGDAYIDSGAVVQLITQGGSQAQW